MASRTLKALRCCILLCVPLSGSYSVAPVPPSMTAPAATSVCARASTPCLGFLDPPSGQGGAMPKAASEAALVQWLESNGVHMSGLAGWGRAAHPLRVESETFEDFELSGRGILARKEIVQGTPLMQIPSKLIMTRDVAVRVLGRSVVPDSLNEYLALALLLIHERSLGASSFFAPYINILPTKEEVGQTWTWGEDELALLSGSGVLDATASLRDKIEREHKSLVVEILRPNRMDESIYDLEAFEWAMSMLLSRAIDLREVGTLALVPYADLLNHSPYSQSYFFYNTIPLSSQREVVLYADRNYAKNDQVGQD